MRASEISGNRPSASEARPERIGRLGRRLCMALLLAGAGGLAVPPAHAQDAAASGDGAVRGDIIVTGSRIVRDGYEAPTPVTVATTENLLASTPSNIPDALNKLPQFQNSSSPSRSSHNFANTAAHGNVLNLRSLGGLRTLVLFDGHRVPPTTFLGTVDTNVIPNLLIERVDIVTGGASAAYGSDAVSGVVNFVLDRKFTGIKGVAQGGISQRGDNLNQRFGLAGGFDFADNRGHILLSGEYSRYDGMLRSDREAGRQGYTYVGSNASCVNPNPTTDPNACRPGGSLNPYDIFSHVLITSSNQYGLISAGPYAGYRMNESGDGVVLFNRGTAMGTTGYGLGGDGYAISPETQANAPYKTYQAYGRLSYEIAPEIEVYAEGSFTRSDLRYVSLGNSLAPPQGGVLFSGNPYLPAEVEAAFTPTSQSITIARYGAHLPSPITSERTDYWEASAGIEGGFGNWTWDANYRHGSSSFHVAQRGLWDWRHFYAAVDAVRDPGTGNIVCRATLDPDPAIASRYAGCQPLNILAAGSDYMNQPGYAYATGTSRYQAKNTQDAFSVNVDGTLFELPAGPLSLAFGAEYRRQKLDLTSNADPALLDTAAERAEYFAGLRGVSPSVLFYYLTNVGVAHGRQNVKEAYGELAVPLLKDVPFFQSLDLNGAIRVTDYSTSGTVTTWKLGATWRPVEDLLLRVTRSRDIRAPNLYELFAGDQSAIGLLNDPVSGISQNVPQVSGGNPGLKPEVANTWTIGGVATPSFLPGFSVSADYYRIRLDGAIGSLTLAQIIDNCYSSGGSAPECSLITRPTPTDFPTQVRVAPANIASLKTSGIDFDMSYRSRLGEGALALRAYASRLIGYESQQWAGAPVLRFEGINVVGSNPQAFPKWRGSLFVDYSIGAFGVSLAEQYVGSMKLGIPGSPDRFVHPDVGSVWYTDLTLRADVPAQGGNLQLFLTVNNLFDRSPPLIPGTTPGANMPTNFTVYDSVGRAFTAGARFSF